MNLAEWERAIEICKVVAFRHGVRVGDLQGRKRDHIICKARTEAVQAVKMGTRLSSVEIGKIFSRCHATILYYLKRVILVISLALICAPLAEAYPVKVRAVDTEPGTDSLYRAIVQKAFRNLNRNFGVGFRIFTWEREHTDIQIESGCADIYRIRDAFFNGIPGQLNLYLFDTDRFAGCAYLCPKGPPEMIATAYITKKLRRISKIIIVHEIGHFLGSEHDPDPNSFMYYSINSNRKHWSETSRAQIGKCAAERPL